MPIAISGRDVSGAADFERLSKIRASLEAANGQGATRNLFTVATRLMRQVAPPGQSYEFNFPPSTFNHEGYGVTLNEINRPYSTPIIDPTGGKALRASFEFVIASRLDGFIISIDSEIKILQEFANYGIPVEFINVHDALATPHWYIDNISFAHTRINNDGQTTAAQCTMSLVEFIPRRKTMIMLPRFQYGKFSPKKKTKTDNDTDNSKNDTKAAIQAKIDIARQEGNWQLVATLTKLLER